MGGPSADLRTPVAKVLVEVRAVRSDDVRQVVELVSEVLAEFGFRFGEGATTDTELRELPDSYASRGGAFWVATVGGELVGTAGVFPVAQETLELRKMYLRPTARGLGVGKLLLDAAIAWARAAGATRMVLDTAEQMTRAISFYEAQGFVRDDSEIRGARCSRGYWRKL